MESNQLIEAFARAVESAKPAQEYCFLWIDWWATCMTKAEWSGWMQAIGAALALLAACQPPAQLLVEKANVQLSPVTDNPSVLYFTIRGGPEDTELRSISSPNILRLEMHETVEENGMSMMKPITGQIR